MALLFNELLPPRSGTGQRFPVVALDDKCILKASVDDISSSLPLIRSPACIFISLLWSPFTQSTDDKTTDALRMHFISIAPFLCGAL